MDFVHADKDGGHFGRIDINITQLATHLSQDRKINVMDVKIGISSVMLCDKHMLNSQVGIKHGKDLTRRDLTRTQPHIQSLGAIFHLHHEIIITLEATPAKVPV